MNREQMTKLLGVGAAGSNPYAEADAKTGTMNLEALLKGKQAKEDVQNAIAKETGELSAKHSDQQQYQDEAQQLFDDNKGKGGGTVRTGPTGTEINAREPNVMGMASTQAGQFLKTAGNAYKPLNDQLDASKNTIDYLNQKNASADKLALINEARLAAGQGGSKALSRIIDLLSGGKTAASDFQAKVNWLENTPNVPEMQDAQRDALREVVFSRVPALKTIHAQTQAQLSQQGPIVAPFTDSRGIIQSFANTANQNLDYLDKQQAAYTASRAKMGPQNPISTPSQADPNPTMIDKVIGMFRGGGGAGQTAMAAPQQQAPQQPANPYASLGVGQQPPAQAPAAPVNDLAAKQARLQELMRKAAGGQ